MPKILDTIRNWRNWQLFAPNRESTLYPRLMSLGQGAARNKPIIKVTPQNLRYLSRTPTARRAINAIKDPIKGLDWEICPKPGVTMNSEIRRQIRVATNCFAVPNQEDSFQTFVEKLLEDSLAVSAGVYEQAAAPGMPDHPVFMWPVDGQSIQLYPNWDGTPTSPRYKQAVGVSTVNSDQRGIDFADDEMVYLPPNPSTNTPYGYGPLEIAATSIARALGAAEFAGSVASNSQPLNIIWLGDVDSTGINAFRTYWRNEVEGLGQTPLIGGPDEPKALRLYGGNDEALYLKWQEFLIREIAVGFDLSPMNFGIQRSSNRSTDVVSTDRDFEHAVKPRGLQLADFFTRHTILKVLGFSQLCFEFPALNAGDEKRAADIFEVLYTNNAITPNGWRVERGLEKVVNPYCDMTYAEVQIAIGEARRGPAENNNQGAGVLHNQSPSNVRAINRR